MTSSKTVIQCMMDPDSDSATAPGPNFVGEAQAQSGLGRRLFINGFVPLWGVILNSGIPSKLSPRIFRRKYQLLDPCQGSCVMAMRELRSLLPTEDVNPGRNRRFESSVLSMLIMCPLTATDENVFLRDRLARRKRCIG